MQRKHKQAGLRYLNNTEEEGQNRIEAREGEQWWMICPLNRTRCLQLLWSPRKQTFPVTLFWVRQAHGKTRSRAGLAFLWLHSTLVCVSWSETLTSSVFYQKIQQKGLHVCADVRGSTYSTRNSSAVSMFPVNLCITPSIRMWWQKTNDCPMGLPLVHLPCKGG